MVNILDVSTVGNNVAITLNLSPEKLAQAVDVFRKLVSITDEYREMLSQRATETWQQEKMSILMMGLNAYRLARKEEKSLDSISAMIANELKVPFICVKARGEWAKRNVRYRYYRRRNRSIVGYYKRGESLDSLAERFHLSKGRISQIIKGEHHA